MTWFERLTGCPESSPEYVRTQLVVEGSQLRSLRNGKSWWCGELETPTLADLRERVKKLGGNANQVSVREEINDVQRLHMEPSNANGLFQVASQFNLLEMMAPDVTPEFGVGIYERDPTQGPACAIAAEAGTIFRNYFSVVNGQIGQSKENQIDCLADMGLFLGNREQRLWEMVNGYALPSDHGLREICRKLIAMDEFERDQLRQSLRIGLQWDTQVTLGDARHTISQALCSALPVAYTKHSMELWAPFAILVLEASYEATICAGIFNAHRTGNSSLHLTLVGGGAFGNHRDWIVHAIRRAIRLHPRAGLDISIVSRHHSKPFIRELVSSLNASRQYTTADHADPE